MRKIFIITIFLLSFSIFANAQQIPNYLFLEVLDSNRKPVKDAKVQFGGYYSEKNEKNEVWSDGNTTDENGKLQTEWTIGSLFRIIKPDYFPFYDLGTPQKRPYTNAKIELLKIPTNAAERKILGDEQIKREFMLAVRNGEVEKVRNFIKSDVNPNLNTDDLRGIAGPKNVPAIIFAASAGNNEMIELFLKSKVNIKTKNEPIHSILSSYLLSNRFYPNNSKSNQEYENGVKMLVKAGAEIKKFPPNETNALMLSVVAGNINLVKFFLEQGLPINAIDRNGKTALFYANSFENTEMFELLLNSGANPNIVSNANNENCQSILMQAVWGGNTNIIKNLIDHKADVNFTCPNGHNALWRANERKRYGYSSDEIIKILTEAGVK